MNIFNKEAIDAHNKYRDIHQAPPLKYSPKLAADAQAHAEKMASEGSIGHAKNLVETGENIAFACGQDYTGGDATDSWYIEVKDYEFNGKPKMGCGHFSQLVWKASTEAGFGKAVDKRGSIYICGRYTPAGNHMSQYLGNVLPSKTGKIVLPQKAEPKPCATSPSHHHAPSPSHHHHHTSSSTHHHHTTAVTTEAPKSNNAKAAGDKLIGKQSSTKTVNGVSTSTVTETFMRPDGTQYTVHKEETKK